MAKKKWVALGLCIVVVVAVFSVWDFDGDGLINVLDANPAQYSFPATNYAKGLITSPEILEKLSCLDSDLTLDGNEISFIDYLSNFTEDQQNRIIQSFLADGKVSSEEALQTKFLNSLSRESQEQMILDGSFNNFNLDGDSWSNYFEEFISKTPYDVKNDIYVLLLTLAGRDYEPVDEMHNIVKDVMKVPENNIYSLNLNNNNPEKFEAALNDIAKRADNNDTVFVNLGGHGNVGIFAFYDGKIVSYDWINKLLEKINSKLTFIAVDSCYSGSAIKYLENDNRILLTQSSANQKGHVGISHEFLKALSNHLADKDGSNYVSIEEAAKYAKAISTYVDNSDPTNPATNRTPQISDKSNIGPGSYLAEFNLQK